MTVWSETSSGQQATTGVGVGGNVGGTVASAASISITEFVTEITGSATIETINGLVSGRIYTLVPAAGSTWQLGTGGNIAESIAAVPGQAILILAHGGTVRSVVSGLEVVLSVKSFGAVGDGIYTNDGAITNGTNVVTSAQGLFAATDVGKVIHLYDGAAGGKALLSTITGYTSATQVTIAATATATLSGATTVWGTDDTTAIQDAFAAVPNRSNATVILFPRGIYLTTGTATLTSGQRIIIRGNSAGGFQGSSVWWHIDRTDAYVVDARVVGDAFGVEDMILAGPGVTAAGPNTLVGVAVGTSGTLAMLDCRITNNWFTLFPNVCVRGFDLEGVHVTNNAFELSHYGVFIDRGGNNIFSENRFYSCYTAGIAVSLIDLVGSLEFGNYNQIVNNKFDICGSTAQPTTTGAILLSNSTGVEIRKTLIEANEFHTNQNDVILNGTRPIAATITGNSSDFATRHFVRVNTTCTELDILNNTIVDSGVGGDNLYDAIYIAGGNNIYVNGNANYLKGATRARYGLTIEAGATNVVIGQNRFDGVSGRTNIAATLSNANFDGPVRFAQPVTASYAETGTCGLRGWADAGTRAFAVNVNFRHKRAAAPSNVTLSGGLTNNISGAGVTVSNITAEGFRLDFISAAAGDTYAVDLIYTVVP